MWHREETKKKKIIEGFSRMEYTPTLSNKFCNSMLTISHPTSKPGSSSVTRCRNLLINKCHLPVTKRLPAPKSSCNCKYIASFLGALYLSQGKGSFCGCPGQVTAAESPPPPPHLQLLWSLPPGVSVHCAGSPKPQWVV